MIHIKSWAFGVKAKAVTLTINLLPGHPVLWSKVTQSRGSICFGLGKEICQTKLFQLFFSEAGNPRQIWRMLKGRKSLSLLLGQRLQQKRWMATAAVNYKVDLVGELLAVNIVQKVPNNALYANSRKKLNSFLLFFRGIIVPCKICSGTALNLFVTISPVKKTLLCSSKAQRIISLSQLGLAGSSVLVKNLVGIRVKNVSHAKSRMTF